MKYLMIRIRNSVFLPFSKSPVFHPSGRM